MIALFVIVVMTLLAVTLGRILIDNSEKNTVEVRSIRAQLAARSGLEMALVKLSPLRTSAQQSPTPICEATQTIYFGNNSNSFECQAVVRCRTIPFTYLGITSTTYRLESIGTCGTSSPDSRSPDFPVSRKLIVEVGGN
ncbi:MSHA biogenesis protein MshP [Aeromonas hydrophila]|uniref:MSHA biogenesis protein MshP n=1 Tax=Aeromonas hydrophila TaxID=644 RepID=UPI001F3B37A8|nr:MSHA biogenesis protein MshP [Aeromonas hydrophila]